MALQLRLRADRVPGRSCCVKRDKVEVCVAIWEWNNHLLIAREERLVTLDSVQGDCQPSKPTQMSFLDHFDPVRMNTFAAMDVS